MDCKPVAATSIGILIEARTAPNAVVDAMPSSNVVAIPDALTKKSASSFSEPPTLSAIVLMTDPNF